MGGKTNKRKAEINTKALLVCLADRGLSQSILAANTFLTEATISRIITGKTVPSLATCQQLCEILKMSPDEFYKIFFIKS